MIPSPRLINRIQQHPVHSASIRLTVEAATGMTSRKTFMTQYAMESFSYPQAFQLVNVSTNKQGSQKERIFMAKK